MTGQEPQTGPSVPPLFAQWFRMVYPHASDQSIEETLEGYEPAEREFWRSLDTGQAAARHAADARLPAGAAAIVAQAAAEVLAVKDDRDRLRTTVRKLQSGAETLGRTVEHLARQLYAMHIDVSRGDLEAVRERALNAIPDVDDNPPEEQWNGTETGSEWLERTREAAQ